MGLSSKTSANKPTQGKNNRQMDELLRIRAELEAKNAELTQANQDLQRTQKLLLQQEKFASIGQLAAGVAHELNNPIGYVQSNLRSLEKYLTSITELSRLLADNNSRPEISVEFRWKEFQEAAHIHDLPYLLEETKALIPESLQGIDRVRQIVTDLKSFSREDESKMDKAKLGS